MACDLNRGAFLLFCRDLIYGKLAVIELFVKSVLLYKLIVTSAFDYFPVAHYKDCIGIFMVERRCATINVVLPSIKRANAFCILTSVLVSMELVASSKMSIGGFVSITRAMHKSCF